MAIAKETAGTGPVLEQPVAETPDAGTEGALTIDSLKGMVDILQKRVNDQSKIIETLRKPKVEAPETVAEPLRGAAALHQLEQKAVEREARVTQKAINTGILSALVEAGFQDDAARKLLPAMSKEGQFTVNELDEVIVEDGSGARPVKDFVAIMLKRDDWRALVPQKKAPDKPVHGRPVIATGTSVGPNENGTYSGAALRAARQG